MTIEVWTARISYGGPDRFDVTRKSGGKDGEPFAPSWAILSPALLARRQAEGLRRRAQAPLADAVERRAWEAYEPAYLAEMRESYRRHPDAWLKLLARPRVVLVCYCADALRCHRFLLAEKVLRKLGADARGELAS